MRNSTIMIGLLFKILFYLVLSISFPIGRLFEIFIWNNQIRNIENVSRPVKIKALGRSCSFLKIVRKLKRRIIDRKKHLLVIKIRERIITSESKKLLISQTQKTNPLKKCLIRRYIFNVCYLDDAFLAAC